MAIKDTKKQVMGKVSALNKLTDKGNNRVDGIKSKINGSKEAINNRKDNVMEFITNLALAITTFEDLKKSLTDIIANQLPVVESAIKNELKKQFKENVNCGVDPSIPKWLIDEGITLPVKKLDIYSMFKTSPNSIGGKLIYNAVEGGINSTDMNTFLYNVIDNNKSAIINGGTPYPWGGSTMNQNLLDVKFEPIGVDLTIPSSPASVTNIFNFKLHQDSKDIKLTELNNQLIDSIDLFGTTGSEKVIINLMHELFGTLNKVIPKPKIQLAEEEKFKKSLECIINAENEVDDSFFTFSNDDLVLIDREVDNKKNGIRKLECCQQNILTLTSDDLISVQNDIQDSVNNPPPGFTKQTSKMQSVSKTIDNLTQKSIGLQIDPIDFKNLRTNLILDMIKNYTKSLISYIISPKLLVVFAINHKLMYGKDSTYADGLDFLKKHKNILKPIFNAIKKMLIKVILNLIIKKLTKKIAEKVKDDTIEKNKAYVKQLKILHGIDMATNLIINTL